MTVNGGLVTGGSVTRWCDRAVHHPGAVSAVLALLCYINALSAGFVYDDSRAIVRNQVLRGSSSWWSLLEHDFWGTPLNHAGSHQSFRPVTTLTFRLNFLFCGLHAAGYHVVNVALHVLATWLVSDLARTLLGRRAAFWSAALFAVHPVHTEAVTGLVGRADLLAAIFLLAALATYRRHMKAAVHGSTPGVWLAATVACAFLATFSKETGITTLLVCFVYDLIINGRIEVVMSVVHDGFKMMKFSDELRRWLTMLTGTACILLLRLSVCGDMSPWFSAADNPVSAHPSLLCRTLTLLYLPVISSRLLLCPDQLSYDWSQHKHPLVERCCDVRNSGLYLALMYASRRLLLLLSHHRPEEHNNNVRCKRFCPAAISRDQRAVVFSVLFCGLTYLPASHLLVSVGFLVAERVLYLPSVGFCLLLGLGVDQLYRRKPRLTSVGVVLLLVTFSLRTVRRNADWHDEASLYQSGIPYSPAKSLANLASVLSERGELTRAEQAYRAALIIQTNMADVHCNLGNLQNSVGKYEDGVRSYSSAIYYRNNLALAHLGLSRALLELGRTEEARRQLLVCCGLAEGRTRDRRTHRVAQHSCLIELGRLTAERDQRPVEALQLYHRALNSQPDQFQTEIIYNLIGDAYYRSSRFDEAERWFRRTLSVKPDMVNTYLNFGKMLSKNKTRLDEAEDWFSRAVNIAPQNPNVYLHYGQFLHEMGRLNEASLIYRRGSELDTINVDLIFNLASTYRELGQLQMAELFYRKAASASPSNVVNLRNLGAILHMNGKHPEAESTYLEALKISPGDQVTTENLQRLRRTRSQNQPQPSPTSV